MDGLLIEPVPPIFDHLRKNFGDNQRFFLEQVAIGANSGKAGFCYVDARAIESLPGLPVWHGQLGAFRSRAEYYSAFLSQITSLPPGTPEKA